MLQKVPANKNTPRVSTVINYLILKNITSIVLLIFLFSCTNDKSVKIVYNENPQYQNDTVVNKTIHNIESKNTEPIQTIKEGIYFVSINNRKSNLKYNFSERNDGKVVISRNFDFPNLPRQKSVFDFDEFKFILKEANKDFKINALNYLIYGTLDSDKDLNSIEKITKKYIENKNGKTTISTKNYAEISQLILQSEIVSQINEDLSFYAKRVSEINIEKAHISKSDQSSTKLINGFVVMKIDDK